MDKVKWADSRASDLVLKDISARCLAPKSEMSPFWSF